MPFRSTPSNRVLVPGTCSPEHIVRNTQIPESYITAHSPPAHHQLWAAELLTQSDLGSDQYKDGIEQRMKVTGKVPFRSKLHFLLANKLHHIIVTPTKETMMWGIEAILAEVFELSLQAKTFGMRIVFFRFLEMTLMDIIHKEILNKILM